MVILREIFLSLTTLDKLVHVRGSKATYAQVRELETPNAVQETRRRIVWILKCVKRRTCREVPVEGLTTQNFGVRTQKYFA